MCSVLSTWHLHVFNTWDEVKCGVFPLWHYISAQKVLDFAFLIFGLETLSLSCHRPRQNMAPWILSTEWGLSEGPRLADSQHPFFPPSPPAHCRKLTLRCQPSCRSFEVGYRSVWWVAQTTPRLLSSWVMAMKVGVGQDCSNWGGVQGVGSWESLGYLQRPSPASVGQKR
jgi:hypothetical protein